MFQELMPLLSQRMLLLTLSRVSDEKICVNVIPKPLKSDQQDDDNALTTPLAVTGTPKELDEHLPKQLVEFVETHLELASSLKSAKELMESATKAAREAAKKSSPKSHSGSSRSVNPGAQVQTEIETTKSSDSSQATTQPSPEPVAGSGIGGITRSLFEPETKEDDAVTGE